MFTSYIADSVILYPSYQLCPGKTISNFKRNARLFASPPSLLPSLPHSKKLIVPSSDLLLSPISADRAHAPAAYLSRSASFVAELFWYGSHWRPLCLPSKPHGAKVSICCLFRANARIAVDNGPTLYPSTTTSPSWPVTSISMSHSRPHVLASNGRVRRDVDSARERMRSLLQGTWLRLTHKSPASGPDHINSGMAYAGRGDDVVVRYWGRGIEGERRMSGCR
jgi:hypothetical protein